MPDQQQPPSSSNVLTNTFSKGLISDVDSIVQPEGSYPHCRNGINVSTSGDIFGIQNEPSNLLAVTLPYTLIGSIPLLGDEWALFTTDDTNSEIGVFNEATCIYTKKINDPCLNFNRKYLITGAYRQQYDCDRKVYFCDANNPDRTVDLDNPPYITNKVLQGDCYIDVSTRVLDCEQLRMAQILQVPTLDLIKGKSSGTLANGSYQATMCYTKNSIKVTDYLVLSEVQGLFTHNNDGGSLQLTITGADTIEFNEMEISIISTINAQTVVKRLGIYSTSQKTIYIDTIAPTLVTIPLEFVPITTPALEKSNSIYQVNNFLLKVGIYEKPEINYQLLANNITTKWVSVQYPSDYYIKGGNKASYMRDEQYPFFIRWIYNTGDKTSSFLISGRHSTPNDLLSIANTDAIELESGIVPAKWQVYNTASITAYPNTILLDGGVVIAEGDMGYWESTEIYPDDKPQIWGNLCGENIRHHKFPDQTITSHFDIGGKTINVLGVRFENIQPPVDNEGNLVAAIVGYEILRGSREGEKTIIAKGLINNMRQYDIINNPTQTGLYQNYPYNDLRPDTFLTKDKQKGTNGGDPSNNLLTAYRQDIFSFHSPDTTFSKPFLSATELKIYQEQVGATDGQFETSFKHPKFKLTTNADDVIGDIVGVLSALNIFTNGMEIGSTEDYPIGLKIGPLPPLPQLPPDEYGLVDTNPATTVLNYALFALQGLEFVASSIELITTFGKFAELEKEKFFSLMRILIPKIQYSTQYNSHGFYNSYLPVEQTNTRRTITNSNYLADNIQTFNTNFQVNNLHRSNGVLLQVNNSILNPTTQDNSRRTISEFGTELYSNVTSTISSYYAALKVNLPAQYGQVDSIKQLPIMNGVNLIIPGIASNSDVLFGGDVYINRFTEKNSFFYFYNWLFDQPDEFEYDYSLYQNVPYARFWVNNTQYMRSILNVSSNYRVLDAKQSSAFYVSQGYFYLFNSGVKDFFVESEVNIAYRDWDDQISKRFYDPYNYTDMSILFRSDLIVSNNFYKYDFSLSNSHLFNSYISWASIPDRDYDPLKLETCFTYYPRRIAYSLPQEQELKKDNWTSFLPNNYRDFTSNITAIKTSQKSGALIIMDDAAPQQFEGIDTLQTTGNVKITVGDGGLFNQPIAAVVNSDTTFQYGSCQSKYSIIGTKYGIFWVSQDQGKMFFHTPIQYGRGGLEEFSNEGIKFWLSRYLPSQLLQVFPNYSLRDNPVVGVGCQTIYDNTNDLLYFTKKDYKPIVSNITLGPDLETFYVTGTSQVIELTDTNYFENASWTLSFDPKSHTWLSYHDWHPTFVLPGKNFFMTALDNTLWKHNVRCDSFCNFYEVDYPFEIEYTASTGQEVTTLRSVEYILESYKYYPNCKDRFMTYDNNFDRAIIYNPEQMSGLLKLNSTPKNNPFSSITYPIVNGNSIDILYDKVENKFRFNQFYDITKDRGEYSGQTFSRFITSSNGYTFQINPSYVDYTKSPLQHKKFRGTSARVFLRKTISRNQKLIFKMSNNKILISER